MNKRLTRTDYLFALTFIFMLVCMLGAFFYGLRMGQIKSDEKYEKILLARKEAGKEPGAYDQQTLVSYYHTIYLPFREFQNAWFEQLIQIELKSSTVDSAAVLKELTKLAQEKYDLLQAKSMPESSPLLLQSHQSYLKSLKLFTDALKSFQRKANAMNGAQLLAAIRGDAFFAEAKSQALAGQRDYFESILKWNQTQNPNLALYDNNKMATFDEWKQMNLNQKNLYVTVQLFNEKAFKSFYPQDLTLRIDDFIATGQSQKLGNKNVSQTMSLLISTDAVRTGDFVKGKSKWYNHEPLPQLPFFTEAL